MIPNLPETNQKRIVILGGGFAGVAFARNLKYADFQIVLLDRNNYHQFQPLLYQVSTSALEANAIAFPFRKIFQGHKNMVFRICEVQEVQTESQKILTDIGEISYDYLVIAIGTRNNFFGNEHIAARALSMKSVSEALLIRNTLLENLEKAEICVDPEERKRLLNIVIVGGGPTGTEIAGTLAEMRNKILPKDYLDLDFKEMKIHLIEGSPYILNSMMSQSSKDKAFEYLKNLGVETMVNTQVKDFDGENVYLGDGSSLPSKSLIWAAGVTGNKIKGLDPNKITKGNRILTDSQFKVVNTENIYAIGDIALSIDDLHPNGHPQLAAVASQEGKFLAKNFILMSKNKPLKWFKYTDKGVMATVGRNKAVVELPFLNFHGFFAWILWMVVHLLLTLGVKNKLIIFINWIWSYFTFDQSLRLIIRAKTGYASPERKLIEIDHPAT